MPWTYLLDVTIGSVRLRLATTETGYVVTKVSPGTRGESLTITRQRFLTNSQPQVGDHVLTEALAAAEAETLTLRLNAQRAARQALVGKRRMRPGSQALRHLERECIATTECYLHRGRALATECARIEQTLDEQGFPTGERDLPAWVAEILDGERAAMSE